MGSLENGVLPSKRDPLLKSSSRNERNSSFVQRPRSRFAKFMVLKKLDYLQWICAVAVCIFFMFVFQMFLPLSPIKKAGDDFLKQKEDDLGGELKNFLKEIGGLDFGEVFKFVPTKYFMKFQRENRVVNSNNNVSFGNSRTVVRLGHRKPQLAFVFAYLLVDPQQILMVTVATSLRAIGYEIEEALVQLGLSSHFMHKWCCIYADLLSTQSEMSAPCILMTMENQVQGRCSWLHRGS